MKELIISLGADLSRVANYVTEQYRTKDYFGHLEESYRDYVINGTDNDFSKVLGFLVFIRDTNGPHPSSEEPLSNVESSLGNLQEVVWSKKGYAFVAREFTRYAKENKVIGPMVIELINALISKPSTFTKVASEFDRKLGARYTTIDIINAMHAYAALTGMVDYYNMEEALDD